MKSKIFTLFITSILLGSCSFSQTTSSSIISSEENNNSSLSSVINPFEEHKEEIFEGNFSKEDITVQYLYDKYCVFFKDLVFATDNMNHVFKIKEDKIIEHYKFPLVKYNPNNFENLNGKDILEVVKLVGCPTILGREDENELIYSCYDGMVFKVRFEKKDNSFSVNFLDKWKKDSWGFETDLTRTRFPSLSDFLNLKVGMCIEDVHKILRGPFYENRGAMSHLHTITLDNGDEAQIYTLPAHSVNCEHFHYEENNCYINGTCLYLYYAYLISSDGTLYEIKDEIKEPLPLEESNDETFMDDSKITIDYLKKNYCIFYENMVFASDKKNHVFFIEDDKIKEHKIYDKINYPKDPRILFESVKGMKLVDTFNIIGIPSYLNELEEDKFDYSLPYDKLCAVELENVDGELIIKDAYKRYYNSESKFDYSLFPEYCRNYNTKRIVTQDDIDYLKNGMCVDDVIRILGKAKKVTYIDSETYEFVYNGENDKNIYVTIKLKPIEKECEHARICYDFSYDEHNKNTYGRKIYSYYFEEYRIVEG